MLLKVKPPQGWSSQDERVLADAEREAERFASYARLAFSLSIATLMLVLSIAVDRWSNWVALIAGASIALSSTGALLTRANVFPKILPWIGICADVLLVFGIGWLGPWRDNLPPGLGSVLVSPWAGFLILAVTSLGLNAARLLAQTLLVGLAIAMVIWSPSTSGDTTFMIDARLLPLFSDGSNITRLGIVLLTGLAMALAASRARRTLMLSIRAARERAVLERLNAAEISRHILSSNVEMLRKGARQRVCILFADIRGFTALSEGLDPSQVVSLLNSFRGRAEQAITDHGGVIDKFIGDGLLAVFGLSAPKTTDARDAIRAATTLAAAVEKWSAKRQRDGRQPIDISIGVHIGDVFVGLLGERRYEFTVIGDAVNAGQRLQAKSRELNTSIVVSAAAFEAAAVDAAAQDEWLRHTNIQLRGRSETMDVHAYAPAKP